MIMNGCYEKTRECIGEVGTSVIDYVVVNGKAMEAIKKVEERNRIESDHIPLEVELEIELENTRGRQLSEEQT